MNLKVMNDNNFVEFGGDIETVMPHDRISFDVDAFDSAIRSQGVCLIHFQAMPCPVGVVDLDDNRRPHPDHEGCTNGFVYEEVGKVTALFIGNSKNKNQSDVGFYDGSTAQASFPRCYDDTNTKVMVAPFDRFFSADPTIRVVTWQRFVHHESGIDRLKFPVCDVVSIKDNAGITYKQDDDFIVANGVIKWIGRQPAMSLDVGPGFNRQGTTKGAVCSVRYTYRPWWYVGQMMHEIRVSQLTETSKGRHIERMPQSVLLHREYVALSKDQQTPGSVGNGIDADSFRTVLSPMYGSFGKK